MHERPLLKLRQIVLHYLACPQIEVSVIISHSFLLSFFYHTNKLFNRVPLPQVQAATLTLTVMLRVQNLKPKNLTGDHLHPLTPILRMMPMTSTVN